MRKKKVDRSRFPRPLPLKEPRGDEPIDWKVVEEAKRQQELQKQRRLLLNAWKQVNTHFDKTPHIEKWDKQQKTYAAKFLDIAVDTFSVAGGLFDANEALKFGMDMPNASLRSDILELYLEKIVKIRVITLITSSLEDIKPDERALIVSRVIAREFPDGSKATQPQQPPQPVHVEVKQQPTPRVSRNEDSKIRKPFQTVPREQSRRFNYNEG